MNNQKQLSVIVMLLAITIVMMSFGSAVIYNESNAYSYADDTLSGYAGENIRTGNSSLIVYNVSVVAASDVSYMQILYYTNQSLLANGSMVSGGVSTFSNPVLAAGTNYSVVGVGAGTWHQYISNPATTPKVGVTLTWTTANNNGNPLGALGFLVKSIYVNNVIPTTLTITPSLPINAQNFTTTQTIDFSANVSGTATILNVSLYINGTLNQTNTSAIQGMYNFSSVVNDGFHNWSIIAYDTNVNRYLGSVRNFSVNPYVQNSVTYNAFTSETFTETYSLNITLRNGVNITSATLNYNGTNYTSAINTFANYSSLNNTLIIPNVTSTSNVSFYWQLVLTSSNYSTSSNQQTINALDIDNCVANTFLVLNYTIYDEDNRFKLTNTTYNTTANVFVKISGNFNGSNYEYFASNVSMNSIPICVRSALVSGTNYRLDSTIQFTADDYVTEYHYIENFTLNTTASPQNVSLYLLLINRSQEFLITFKDTNLIPVEGALIELSRQYLSRGQFLSVEISKTDNDGKTIGHFVLNDEVYTIYVKKNGVLLATYENVRAFCSDVTTGDCRINLNQAGTTTNPQTFINYLGVIGTDAYNETSRTYTFDFTTNDSASRTINVTILKYDNYLNTSICSQSLTSSSGTLTCIIPGAYYNDTGLVTIYVNGVEYSSYLLDIAGSNSATLNPMRYLLAFFIIITLPLLAYSSGVMVLLMFIVGLVLAVGLYLIDTGGFFGPLSAFIWFVVAAIILMIKAAQRRQQ